MSAIEYLEKKVEALETLYKAEKERAEEIQQAYAGLEKRMNEQARFIEQIANYLHNIPTYWH